MESRGGKGSVEWRESEIVRKERESDNEIVRKERE